ncbi:MAG TPA: hypothetical protein VGO49_09960 [Bradyrhizobium sp.]|jgi:hypothetical protein|nr:hypothetical protein [Bradyrhizobium sp.]
MISLSYIGGAKSNNLRYVGDNYDPAGQPLGFFEGELLDVSDDQVRFTYSNRKSVTNIFEEGITTHHFSVGADGRWHRHQATAWDHAKNEKIVYQGFRAKPDQIRTIKGDDHQARIELIREYARLLRPVDAKPSSATAA